MLELGRPDPRLSELMAGYPEAVFSERLYQLAELTRRYCSELTLELLYRLNLPAALEEWRSASDTLRHRGFHRQFSSALAWLLSYAASTDYIATKTDGGCRFYRLSGTLPPRRTASVDELRAAVLEFDDSIAPTFKLLDTAAAAYPAVARGDARGEELLFGLGQLNLWLDYFDNRNCHYAVNNAVAAESAARHIAELAGNAARPLKLLEIGAGAGSAAAALLETLGKHDLTRRLSHYAVTEPNGFFRRRAERALKKQFPALTLAFHALDIDQPWEPQGVAAGDFDLIYGVNVLHVAKDLKFSLDQARRGLVPGGRLVAGECVRPFPGQPVDVELMFQLLEGFVEVTLDPELRPNPGFLTPEQWLAAFAAAGFVNGGMAPDCVRIRTVYPYFFAGAISGESPH